MDDPEYIKMQTELQKYLPFLENMIAKLQNAEKMQGKSRLAQLAKMQSLYGILTNKKKKMKIETLHKCEEVLKNLHEKVDVPDCPTKPVTMQKPKPTVAEPNETPLKTILTTLKLNASSTPASHSSSPTDNNKTENTPVEKPSQDRPLVTTCDDLSLLQKYNDRNRSPPPELVPEKVLVSMLRGSVTRLESDEKDNKRDSRTRSSTESTRSDRSRDHYKSEKSSRRRSPYRKRSKSRTPNRDSSSIYKRRSRSREREILYRRRSRSPPRSRNRIDTSRNAYSKRRIPSPKCSYEPKKPPSSIGKDNADIPLKPSVKDNKKENVLSLNAHTKKETNSLTVFDRLGVKVKSPVRTVNDNEFKVSTTISKSVIPNLNSPPLTMDDIEKLLAENKDNSETTNTQAATVPKDQSVYSSDNLVAKEDMDIQELKKVRDQIRDELKHCVPSPKEFTSNEPKTPPSKVITIRKVEEVSVFGNALSSIDTKILEVNNKINKKDLDKEKSHKSKKESETEDSKVRKDKNQKVNVSHDKSKSGSSTDSSSSSSSTCHSSDKSSCGTSKADKLTNSKQTKDVKTIQIDKNISKATTLIESKHVNEAVTTEIDKDIKKAVILTQSKDHRTTQLKKLVGKAVYENPKLCSSAQDKNCSNNDNTTNTSVNLDSNKEKDTTKDIVSNPVQSRRLSDKYPRKKVTEMKDNINAQTSCKIADLEVTPPENVINASLDMIDLPRGKVHSNIPDVKPNDPRKKHSSPSFKDSNTNPINSGNIPSNQFSNEICNFPNSINEFQFPSNKDTDMRSNKNVNMVATTTKFSAPRRPLLPNPTPRPLINSPIHQIPNLLGPYPNTIHQPVMYTNNHSNRLSNPDMFERNIINRNNERGGFARRGRGKFRNPGTRFQTYGEINNMVRAPEYHRQHPQNVPDATNVPSSTLSPKPNNSTITLPAKVSDRDPRRSIDRDPRNRPTNTIIQTPSEDFSIKSVYKEPIATGKSFHNYKIPRLKRDESTDVRQEVFLTPGKLIQDSNKEEEICNKELSSRDVENSEECSTVEDILKAESLVDTVADNNSNIKSKVSETKEQDEHTINNIQSVSDSLLPEKNVLQLEGEDNNVLPENEASDTRKTMDEKSEIQNIVKEEQATPDSTNEVCNEIKKDNKSRKIPTDSSDDNSDDSRTELRSLLNHVVAQYTKKKKNKKKNKNKISKLKKLLGPKKFQKFLERIFEFDSESEENSSESDNNSDHEAAIKEKKEIFSPVVKQRTRKRIAALKSSSSEDESDNNQKLIRSKATTKLSNSVDEFTESSVRSEVHEKRPKRRNALEMLQLDVRDMFISDDVVHANGRRQCRTYGDDKIETDVELKTSPRTRKTRSKSILTNSLVNNETDDEENSEIQPNEDISPKKRFPLIVLEKLAGDKDTTLPQKNIAVRGRGVARRGRKNFRRISNRNFDEQNIFEATEISEIDNGGVKDTNSASTKSPESEPESVLSCTRVLRGSVNKSISTDEPNTSIDNEDELQASLAEAEEETDVNNATTNGANNIKQRKKIKRKNSWRLGILTKGKKIRKKSSDAALKNIQMSRILNNDLTYCFIGPEKYRCKLCTFNGKSIGVHYAIMHPESEVHISRLNAEEAVLALNEKDTEADVPTSLLMTMFNYICRFCNDSIINCSPMTFYEHIVTHTGELRVACSDCNYKAVKPESIKSHSKTAHGVNSTLNSKILYDLPAELHPIYGYICTECNFTQYLEDNVIKHIKGTHRNIMIKIAKIKLYRIEIDSLGISKKRKTVEETSFESAQTETESEGGLAVQKLCYTSESMQQSPELEKVLPDENINIKKECVLLDTNCEIERNNSDRQKEATSVIEQPKKIVSEFSFDNMLPLKMSITERLKQKIDMLAEEERRKAAAAVIAKSFETLLVASEELQVTKDNTTSITTSITTIAPCTTIVRSEPMEICNPEPSSPEAVEDISTRDIQVDEQSEGGDNDCDWIEDMESNDSYSALDSNKALEHVDEVLKMVDEQKRDNELNSMVNNTIQRLAASLKTKPQISQILDINTSNLLNNEVSESSDQPPTLVSIVIKQKQGTGIVVGMVSAEIEPNYVRLSCLVQGCIFQCVSRDVLTNHFEMCHPLEMWDGFCNICKRQLVLPSPGPNFRLHCVDHLFMYHIKDKSKDVASKPAKGLIKLRRLSGDILSVVKPENEFSEDTNDDLPPLHLLENSKISDSGQTVTNTAGNIGSRYRIVKKTINPNISSTSILMNELNRMNTSPVSSLLNDIKALPNKNKSAGKSETSAGPSGQPLQTPKNSVDTSFTSNKILFSANKFVGKKHAAPIFLRKVPPPGAASVIITNLSSTSVVTPSITSIVSLAPQQAVSQISHKKQIKRILPKSGLSENYDVTNLTSSSNKGPTVTSCGTLPNYNFSTSVDNAGSVNLFKTSDSVNEPIPSINYLVIKPVPESTTAHEIINTVSLVPVDVISQTDTDTIGINDENSSKSVNTDSVSMDPLDIDDPLAIDPLAEENEVSSDVISSNMIQIQDVWSMAKTIPEDNNVLSCEVESVSKQPDYLNIPSINSLEEETKDTITSSDNKTCKSASLSKTPETKRHLINLDVSTDNILPQHVRRGGASRAASSPLSKKSPSKSPSTSNIKKTPEKRADKLPLPPRPKPPSNLNINGIAGDDIIEVVVLEDEDYEITASGKPVSQLVKYDCEAKPWIQCKSLIKKTLSTYTLTKLTHLYKCMSHCCSYSTQIKTNFIDHIKSHALWNYEHDKNASKDYYECAYCSLNFESSGAIAIHIDECHSHCQYQCRYCFYRAENRVYIMKHMDTYHNTVPAKILVIPVSEEVKAKNILLFESKEYILKTMIPFKCSVPRCFYVSSITKEFRDHLRTHRIEKVKCHECEEILPKPKDLLVHSQKHHKYFYHCIYCRYGDEIRDNLAGHLMVTHPEYPARVTLRTPDMLINNNQFKYVALDLSGTPRHMELLQTDLDHTGSEEKIEYEGTLNKNYTDTAPLISDDNGINVINDSDSDNDNLVIDEGPGNDEEDPDWRPSQESRSSLSHTAKKIFKKPDSLHEVTGENEIGNTSVSDKSDALPEISTAKITVFNESVNGDSFLSSKPSSNLNVDKGVEVIQRINDAEDVTESDPLLGISDKIPLRSNELEDETSLTSTQDITNASLNSIPSSILSTNEKMPDEDDLEHVNKKTVTFKDSSLNNTNFSNNEGLEDNLVQVTLETIKETGKSGSELFVCCYCDFSSESSSELKSHCNECTEKTSDPIQCPHCERCFKWVAPYVEHIKVHGTHRYGCSLCNFRAPVQANVRKHLRQTHKVSFIEIVPSDPSKSSVDLDLFIVRPKLDMSKAVAKNSSFKMLSKNKYSPTEIEKLPIKSIYNDDVYCVLCAFKTKVRSNMVRHLQQHAAEKLVSAIAPVNPVPCLETNEKHFDKMTNLAISSHEDGRAGLKTTKNVDVLTLEEEKAFPMYISAGKRFVCGISNCKYLTVNEEMLKHHYKALHSDDTDYSCPHCPNKGEKILKGPICIEDILDHLRNHEAKLYRCPHCVYYKNHRNIIETHIKDNHSDLAGTVKILREIEEDNTLIDEKSSKVKKQKNWKCDLCTTKTVDQMEIMQHVLENHGLRFQYQCAYCMFRCSETIHFNDHFSVRHADRQIQYASMYSKVIPEGDITKSSTASSNLNDTTPLWSRENNGCRYIRGILVDEENDKIAKGIKVAVNDSTKGSTSEKSRLDGFASPSKLRKRKHKSNTTDKGTIDSEETEETLNCEPKGAKRRRTVDSVKTKIQPNNSEINDISLLDDKNEFVLSDSSMDFGPIIDFTLEDDVLDISAIGDLDDTDSQPSSYINITNDIPQMMSALNNDYVDSNDAGVVVEGFYGPYGEPKDGKFVCPLCMKFTTSSSAEMENHLFIELQYMRWQCGICSNKSHDKVELIDSCQLRHPQSYNIENITQLPIDNEIVEWISKLFKTQSALLVPQVSLLQNEILDKELNQKLSAPVSDQGEFVDSDKIKKDVVSLKRKLQSKNTQITEDIQKAKLETHSSKKLNKCKFCKYTGNTNQDVKRHELRHLKERPYTCGYCSYGNIEERLVKKHCETKHIGREIKINNNIPQDESKVDIKPVRHIKTSLTASASSEEEQQITLTEDTVYGCQYCPKTAKQIKDLHQHWAAVHKNDKVCADGKIRKGTVFQYRIRPKKEVSKKSGGKNHATVFKCLHCGKLATLKTMKHHQKESHPLLPDQFDQVSVASYVFSCKLCTYVVSAEKTMQNHYAENHKHNRVDYLLKVTDDEYEPTLENAKNNCKFKCEYCVEISETQAKIKEHHERLHSHKALIINREYDTPALTTSKSKYRCATCNYQTNYFNCINDHIVVHLKPYLCFYCNKPFSKSIDVEHHCKYAHPDKVHYKIYSEEHSDQLLNDLRNGINVQMSNDVVKLFEDLTKEEKANLVQDFLKPKSNVKSKEPLSRKTAASTSINCTPSKIMRHKDDLDISTSSEAFYQLNESLNLEQEHIANPSKET